MFYTIKNGLSFELNKNDFTAQIVSSNNAKGSIFIPRSINYELQDYVILAIKQNSFKFNSNIKSIEFSDDSQLKSIEKNAFLKSSIEKLTLPSSVEELQEGWCKKTSKLVTVSISPKNKNFICIDGKLIIGKTDKNSDKFDNLVFACRDIQKVNIPSYVRNINSFSFSECKYLSKIIIPDNSELRSIGSDAFSYTSIENLPIPSAVEFLDDRWCRKTSKLTKITLSNKNKNFSFIENKFLLGKSDKSSDVFDTLLFASREIDSASIPSYVKYIRPYSFCECENLSKLEFSDDSELLSVQRNAFSYTSLECLHITSKVKDLQEGWCKNVSKLNSITVSPNNKIYKTINNDQIVVGKYNELEEEYNILVFASRNIKEINIPSYIKEISGYSISLCKHLENIQFDHESKLNNIKQSSFCKSTLKSINIPKQVKEICEKSFFKCENLQTVEFSENHALTKIGRKAFAATQISSISIPSSVIEIGIAAFQECEYLNAVEFEEDSKLCSIERNLFAFTSIENIVIPANVRSIGERSFAYCKNLKSINFYNNSKLKIISNEAFSYSSIEQLYLPEEVEYFQEGWCSYTNQLTHITISANNKHIKYHKNKYLLKKEENTTRENENEQFNKIIFARRDIEEAHIPSYIQYIESYSFNECENLKNVEIEENSELISIGYESFSCTSIEQIEIPSHVREIGERAFYWCKKLKTFLLPENSELREFNKQILLFSSIESLYIPASIEDLKDGWCDFLNKLKKVVVSPNNKNFATINDKLLVKRSPLNKDEYNILVFASRDIEEVVIPSTIEYIAPFCFSWCKSLKSVKFEANSKLRIIGDEAFGYLNIQKIFIPSSVEHINDRVFYECLDLRSVVLTEDSKLCSIGKNAFAFTSLESIFIPPFLSRLKSGWCNHVTELNKISVSSDNKIFKLINDQILIGKINDHADNEDPYEDLILVRRDAENVEIPSYIKRIRSYSFCGCSSINQVKILNDSKLLAIEEDAFIKSSLKSIFIPSKVEDLQDGWCSKMPKLNHITISPDNKRFSIINEKILLKKSYKYCVDFDVLVFACRDIEKAIIPSYIKQIGNSSFALCKNLRSVEFSENSNIRSIEENSFKKSSIENITIPPLVRKIGEKSFYKCNKLLSIKFSENSSLNIIEKYAFAQTSIDSIIIPSSVCQINKRTFQKCENLNTVEFEEDSKLCSIERNLFAFTSIENIVIPANVRSIGERSFAYCKNLKSINFYNNSKLKIISNEAFFYSSIEQLYLPEEVEYFQEGWCSYTNQLTHITISTNNKHIKYHKNKYLLKKEENTTRENENEQFNKIIFARRDIEEAHIPSYIQYIESYSFNECENLKNVEIEENSELISIGYESFSCTSIEQIEIPPQVREIGERAFYWCKKLRKVVIPEDSNIRVFNTDIFFCTPLEELFIPANVNELKTGWCNFAWKLKRIKVSPKNKNFKFIDNTYLVGKSDINCSDYDVILMARRDIKSIIIPLCIKKIDSYAFSWCSGLKSVSFSEYSRLSSIGVDAFSFTSFQTINIPSRVEKICNKAFYRCDFLKSVIIPEDSKLKFIGKNAFAYTQLESIYIPSSLINIKDGCFTHTPKLNNISASPDNQYYKYIDNKFLVSRYDNNVDEFNILILARRDVENVEIPSFIRQLNSYSFCECINMKNVKLAEDSNLEIIKEGSFVKTPIEYLHITSKVKDLQEGWCKNVSKLNSITVSPNNKIYKTINNDQIVVGKYNELEEEYNILVFASRNIKEINIPSYIKEISGYSISLCKHLENIQFDHESKLNNIKQSSFCKSTLKSINIPKQVKQICEKSFFKCENLQTVEFSENSELNLIDKKAFAYTPINTISIPSNVKILGEKVFFSCNKLETVGFSDDSKLIYIDKSVFASSSIENIVIPSNVNKIADRAFFKCKNLKSVKFVENSRLHVIDQKVFARTSIEHLNLPSEVEDVRNGWISYSNKLNDISVSPENKYFSIIENNLIIKKVDECESIHTSLVYAPYYTKKVIIPSYVNSINSYVFCANKHLISVNFSEDSKLHAIHKKAFSKTSIISISIPSSVKYIQSSAFSFCKYLCSCEFSGDSKLCSIERNLFSYSYIRTIKIPPNVMSIKERAFSNCSNLISIDFYENSKLLYFGKFSLERSVIETLYIPSNVKELKEDWCSNLEKLTNVLVSAENPFIKNLNDGLIIGKSDPLSDEYDEIIFACRDIKSAKIPSCIKRIRPYAFASCNNLRIVEFEDGSQLTSIGKEAFASTSIRYILIPDTVNEIGEKAFHWCRKLKSVVFSANSKLKMLSRDLFFYSSIEELFIPASVEELIDGWNSFTLELNKVTVSPDSAHFIQIDDNMIAGKSDPSSSKFDTLVFANRDIRDIFIPSFIKQIGKSCFSWCKFINSVNFAKDSELQLIDDDAFSYSNIHEISLPASIATIEEDAFLKCGNLISVAFDDNSKIASFAKNAFAMSGLEEISIPANVDEISSEWFRGVNKLKRIKLSKYNKNFVMVDDKYLIGKSDKNSDNYDVLLFSPCDLKQALIPSFVKQINPYSLSYCSELEWVKFSEDTQIRTICDNAFLFSSLKTLCIPSSLQALKEGWCNKTDKLVNIEISPNSKTFYYLDDKLIIGKSENSDHYDTLKFARRNIHNAIIPSSIKIIDSCAFCLCSHLNFVFFQEDSTLEEIHDDAFSSTELDTFSVPNTIKTIDNGAFSKCEKLKSVEFLGDSVILEGEIIHEKGQFTFMSCPNAHFVSIDREILFDVPQSFTLFTLPGANVV